MSISSNNWRDSSWTDKLNDIRIHFESQQGPPNPYQLTFVIPADDVITITDGVTTDTGTPETYKVTDDTAYEKLWLSFSYDTLDGSGNGNHGTITGNEIYAFPLRPRGLKDIEQAFSFDGATYITIANESQFDFERTDTFSICYFGQTSATGILQKAVTKNTGSATTGYECGIDTSGRAHMRIINTITTHEIKVQTTAHYNDGLPHHYIWTYAGTGVASGVSLYIDGTAVALTIVTDNLGANTILNNHAVVIGADGNGANKWNGTLDEIHIYNFIVSNIPLAPMFIFMQWFSYPTANLQSLANIYAKYAKPTDIIQLFNNPADTTDTGFHYLSSIMTTTLPNVQWSLSYNSNVDSANNAPTAAALGYKWQQYDYEQGNTPADQLDAGLKNAIVNPGNNKTGVANFQAANIAMATGIVRVVKITGLTSGTKFDQIAINVHIAAGNVKVKVYQNNGAAGDPGTLLGTSLSTLVTKIGIFPIPLTGLVTVPASGILYIGFENDDPTLQVKASTGQAANSLKTAPHSFPSTDVVGTTTFGTVTNGTTPFYCKAYHWNTYGDADTEFNTFATACRNNGMSPIGTPSRSDNGTMTVNGVKKAGQYCDIFIIQAQGLVAGDQTVFRNSVITAITNARANNPSVKIILELSTVKANLTQMQQGWDTVKDLIDGIHVFHAASGSTILADQATMDGIFAYAQGFTGHHQNEVTVLANGDQISHEPTNTAPAFAGLGDAAT